MIIVIIIIITPVYINMQHGDVFIGTQADLYFCKVHSCGYKMQKVIIVEWPLFQVIN